MFLPQTHTMQLREMTDVLINLIVVIILKYTCVANYYIVHVKRTQCVNYISKLEKIKNGESNDKVKNK